MTTFHWSHNKKAIARPFTKKQSRNNVLIPLCLSWIVHRGSRTKWFFLYASDMNINMNMDGYEFVCLCSVMADDKADNRQWLLVNTHRTHSAVAKRSERTKYVQMAYEKSVKVNFNFLIMIFTSPGNVCMISRSHSVFCTLLRHLFRFKFMAAQMGYALDVFNFQFIFFFISNTNLTLRSICRFFHSFVPHIVLIHTLKSDATKKQHLRKYVWNVCMWS